MSIPGLFHRTAARFQTAKSPNARRLKLTMFCDFDGPLVDVSERYYGTYRAALQHTQQIYAHQGQAVPLKCLSKDQFWQMKRQRVSDIEIAIQSGLQEEQITFFLDHVRAIVNDATLLHLDKMQGGVNWSLGLLHSYGVKLVLVTLREKQQVCKMLDQYGLRRLFSGIYGSDNHQTAYLNNAEAKTALLKQAIAEQGEVSDQWLMVGDTEADIVAAKNMKIAAIAVTCGIRDLSTLEGYQPEHCCSDLLSVAHFLLECQRPSQAQRHHHYCFSGILT
ncbi:haloacid dehalogenase-like hydrolase domain protein [[Synechococcus] sp. NIES-970]|uniref:HAD family hydrolase n=1 Tax=Picosynechococcus sp. NKBG15041c TaxID=1407650 RepID=UPI0004162B29|nr:HAD family hydrolase [Picosynechococcus sp. NKBG15041c]BAW97300.1 haloacid dehalogenase-like hydrolase domain protein [[Synechococcus] sp. NIES-970]